MRRHDDRLRSRRERAVTRVGRDAAFQPRALDPRSAELAALLAEGFSVYHYDRRGRGDSGDSAPYAVEREIEDLGALIEHAGESAFVFGMSAGAVLALRPAAAGLAIRKLASTTSRRSSSTTVAQIREDRRDHGC